MNATAFYDSRLTHFGEVVATMQRRADRIADIRLLVFLAGLALAAGAWWGYTPGWLLAVPIAGFIALIVAHERSHRALAHARLGEQHYRNLLEGMRGNPPACRQETLLQLPAQHVYMKDLDIFGAGGLFALLCRARTQPGAQTLAGWLLSPAAPDIALARQSAAQELSRRPELLEALALAGGAVQAAVSARDLRRWSDEPAQLGVGWRIPAAWGLSALAASGLALAFAGLTFLPILSFAIGLVFLGLNKGGIAALSRSLEPIGRELRTLASVIELLERETFQSPLLQAHVAALSENGERASVAIRKLDRLTAAFEMYFNQLFMPVAIMTLWPWWWGWAIERWRAQHRDALQHRWMDALGNLEALCSLAGYAFERDEDAWPVFVEEKGFNALALGHPLLPRTQGVRNDVLLDGDTHLLMVSGSNMSGKSTLLRAVGLNAVLAQAGAPVCATSLHLSALQVGAVIRVEDSIQRGASRFYAEIERFRALLDLAKSEPPLLFLSDEILHGTNTRDRVTGAEALMRALLQAGAIGFVTTHDLALTAFVQGLPRARNVHFQDDIIEGKLAFDYRLREGVVTRSNALELMRAIGLPVE